MAHGGIPLSVMAKPAGASCNLACEYCYYADKSRIYGNRPQMMTDELLEQFIRDYIASQPQEAVMFTWHGGEPLLRNRKFYELALSLQRKHADGHHIDNCIQTNGTLINQDWCKFFHDNNFLIGLSIDGPMNLHDEYRCDHQDRPTFLRVLKAARLLQTYGVDWNAMATVNNVNADHPLEFYRFFRDTLKCRYLQFTPIVERIDKGLQIQADVAGGDMAPYSVTPEQWGSFLCTIFDEWVKNDVGKMYVQLFDATLANYVGVPPGVCTLAGKCGQALVMEHNGDVFSCDHFVYPDHHLGNILESSFPTMLNGERHQGFIAKSRQLSEKCLNCRYIHICNGECPKNRIVPNPEGGPNLNYLCEGYFRFFSHTEKAMLFMRNEIINDRAPANIMNTNL